MYYLVGRACKTTPVGGNYRVNIYLSHYAGFLNPHLLILVNFALGPRCEKRPLPPAESTVHVSTCLSAHQSTWLCIFSLLFYRLYPLQAGGHRSIGMNGNPTSERRMEYGVRNTVCTPYVQSPPLLRTHEYIVCTCVLRTFWNKFGSTVLRAPYSALFFIPRGVRQDLIKSLEEVWILRHTPR